MYKSQSAWVTGLVGLGVLDTLRGKREMKGADALREFASHIFKLFYFTISKTILSIILFHTILQYIQHPNFYFIIQHIKII